MIIKFGNVMCGIQMQFLALFSCKCANYTAKEEGTKRVESNIV